MSTLHTDLASRFTDADEIKDIAYHGSICGVSGFIYYHECVLFFDTHEEEIYDYLNDCGISLKNFIHDQATITTLKNDMVWAVIDLWCQSQQLVNEMEALALA